LWYANDSASHLIKFIMSKHKHALTKLHARRNPDRLLKEAYAQLQEDACVVYLVGAMEPVAASFTKHAYDEGDRVANHIAAGLALQNIAAQFEYQGSVTKNTHIKAYSDIDLLVLDKRFVIHEKPEYQTQSVKEEPVQNLIQVRQVCVGCLGTAFPKANVDASGPKSVRIQGGSLARSVDLVPAHWVDTDDYLKKKSKVYRGVQILDAHVPRCEFDQPFIHSHLLDVHDERTRGNTRKLIRLLKSIKYDSESRLGMSSYNIESIIYRMPESEMQQKRGEEIPLAYRCLLWLKKLEDNHLFRDALQVPDGKRLIFTEGKATPMQLTELREKLEHLLQDIDKHLKQTFRRLEAALIKWPSPAEPSCHSSGYDKGDQHPKHETH